MRMFISAVACVIALAAVTTFCEDQIFDGHLGYVIPIAILLVIVIVLAIILRRQPRFDADKDKFQVIVVLSHFKLTVLLQVPWIPFIPIISIFCNLYLMCNLDVLTWIRFGVWMILGFLVYGFY